MTNFMKTKLLLLLTLFFSIQGLSKTWTHVGPISTNLLPVNGLPNLFETAQINLIEVDPRNENHWFCGGRFAGLWESTDGGGNWTRIPTQHLGSNGVGKIHFLNAQEIFVSNLHVVVGGVKVQYSMLSGIFNFKTKTWEAVNRPSDERHIIHDVTSFTEKQRNFIVMCASMGIYISDDKGLTGSSFRKRLHNRLKSCTMIKTK